MSKTPSQSNTSTSPRQPREGMRRVNGDVVGFRDIQTQGSLYGIPRAAKLSDNGQDLKKPSCFVIFEALEDMKVTEGTGDEAQEILAKKGDMVGLWLKGGMRQIRNLCGIPVEIHYGGEKKLKGRPAAQKPMQVYNFDLGEGKGTPIPVIEDNRKQSRNEPTMFDFAKPGVPRPSREPGDDSEEQPYGF